MQTSNFYLSKNCFVFLSSWTEPFGVSSLLPAILWKSKIDLDYYVNGSQITVMWFKSRFRITIGKIKEKKPKEILLKELKLLISEIRESTKVHYKEVDFLNFLNFHPEYSKAIELLGYNNHILKGILTKDFIEASRVKSAVSGKQENEIDFANLD